MKDLIDRKTGRMKLIDAPVGVFVFHDELVLKTEYMTDIDGVYIPDCYILSTGEKFWGGMKSTEDFKTKYNNLDVEVIDTLPSAQPEQRYTEEELRVFKHGISLSLLSKRSAQHWRYDEDTATKIEFLERLYEKVRADMRSGDAE